LSDLPAEIDFVVCCFQRDHYCTNCRSQVQDLAEHVEAFRDRDAEVVSIVPEPLERVEQWQAEYDLPYPLLADPETTVCSAYDQPVRFGILGKLSDFFGRMPAVVIVDCRGETQTIAYAYQGSSTFDRPEIATLLEELDEQRAEPPA
jgi:peroxiredoxin Q/BCP